MTAIYLYSNYFVVMFSETEQNYSVAQFDILTINAKCENHGIPKGKTLNTEKDRASIN